MKKSITYSLSILVASMTVAVGAQDFYLDGPHLYPTHSRASDLFVGDLNNDGKADFGTVENTRGLLRIHLSQDAEAEKSFEEEEILLSDFIFSAVVLDCNGDGLDDLLISGRSKKVQVAYQTDEGTLEPFEDFGIEGTNLFLTHVNGDEATDLIVLNDQVLSFYFGNTDGIPKEKATSVSLSSSPNSRPQMSDLNGDNLVDLLYQTDSDDDQVHVFFQTANHDFPEETVVEMNSFYDWEVLETAQEKIITTVHKPTRRLTFQHSVTRSSNDEKIEFSNPKYLFFTKERPSITSSAIAADLNGDGLTDMMSGIQGQPYLRALMQLESGNFSEKLIPSFTNITKIAALDSDQPRFLTFSSDEKILGIANWDSDAERLLFPSPIKLDAEPIAFEYDQVNDLLLVGMKDSTTVTQFTDFSTTGTLQGEAAFEIPKGKNLENLKLVDLDQDGTNEIVRFYEYSSPQVFQKNDSGEFNLISDVSLLDGMLDKRKPFHLQSVPESVFGESSTLIVRDEFARIFQLQNGQMEIDHQLIGKEKGVRYSGVAFGKMSDSKYDHVVLKNDSTKRAEIFQYDDETKNFEFLTQTDENLSLSPTDRLFVFDTNSDGISELLILGDQSLTILDAGQETFEMEVLENYVTETEDGGYGRLYEAGKVGEQVWLPAIEMEEYSLDFFVFEDSKVSVPYRFKVFSKDWNFGRRNPLDESPEPRELLWKDMDNDGQDDLLILAHDEVVIYYLKTE